MFKHKLVFLFITFGLFGCTSSQSDESLSQDICTCIQPLVDLNLEMQDLAVQGQQDKLQSFFGKAEKLSVSTKACVQQKMMAKGVQSETDKAQLLDQLRKQCPRGAVIFKDL